MKKSEVAISYGVTGGRGHVRLGMSLRRAMEGLIAAAFVVSGERVVRVDVDDLLQLQVDADLVRGLGEDTCAKRGRARQTTPAKTCLGAITNCQTQTATSPPDASLN